MSIMVARCKKQLVSRSTGRVACLHRYLAQARSTLVDESPAVRLHSASSTHWVHYAGTVIVQVWVGQIDEWLELLCGNALTSEVGRCLREHNLRSQACNSSWKQSIDDLPATDL